MFTLQDLQTLKRAFRSFAVECQETSPLYEFLSLKIAKCDDILKLCKHARSGQPPANILFGAVHHLLLNGRKHPLEQFYPSIVTKPLSIKDSFSYFLNFCQTYRKDIIHLLQTKLVQTNEINRCAYLYPVFSYIYDVVKKPLAFIEIGTSAGLQLIWDKYRYSYDERHFFGDPESSVYLTSKVRGGGLPEISWKIPPITERIGIDLHVNDVTEREDYLWLLSLIWPEHHERRERFIQAAQLMDSSDIQLIEGDGIARLEELIAMTTSSSVVCLFHTHVANQFSQDQKNNLLQKVENIGQKRNIVHIYNNMWDLKLYIDSYIDGEQKRSVVGAVDGHGKWFTWHL